MKTTKNIKWRNNIILLAAMISLLSLLIVGCSSEEATEPIKSEPEAVVKEEAPKVEEVVVQETTEDVAQSTEEVQGQQSLSEWAQTVDATEPKMAIWNDITKEGIILENEQKYSLKEGDLLVVCTKEKENGLEIHSTISVEDFKTRISEKYITFEFSKEILEETSFEIQVTVADVPYTLGTILVFAETTDIASKEGSESTEMSGKDWASSLSYEEPKLLAWNDETGTKEVIENGGQYNMQQGDVLAIHCPAEHYVTTGAPIEFAKGVTVINNFWKLDYVLPSESQEINLEIGVLNPDGEMENLNYVITTP